MPVTYIVVHESSTLQVDTGVVRELGLVDIGAVGSDVSSVIDLVAGGIKEAHALYPLPRLLGPVGICGVASVTSESSAKVEEAAVGNALHQVSRAYLEVW